MRGSSVTIKIQIHYSTTRQNLGNMASFVTPTAPACPVTACAMTDTATCSTSIEISHIELVAVATGHIDLMADASNAAGASASFCLVCEAANGVLSAGRQVRIQQSPRALSLTSAAQSPAPEAVTYNGYTTTVNQDVAVYFTN